MLIVDAEGQRVVMPRNGFSIVFEAVGGGSLTGKLAATHSAGGAVFPDLAVFANMESDVYLKGTATIGPALQTRHLYVGMLAGPGR